MGHKWKVESRLLSFAELMNVQIASNVSSLPTLPSVLIAASSTMGSKPPIAAPSNKDRYGP